MVGFLRFAGVWVLALGFEGHGHHGPHLVFLAKCKSLGRGFFNIFERTTFNPCKMQKLAMVILAKFWSRSCRSNLACL